MRIMIFEWLTGGGMFAEGQFPNPNCPFQTQGRAMLQAVAADLASAGHEAVVPADERIAGSLHWLSKAEQIRVTASDDLADALLGVASTCDQLLLIAPECDSCLLTTLDWLAAYADRLISPDRQFVQLASNKSRTIDWLKAHQIPTAPGMSLPGARTAIDLPFPAVIKPIDGAGSDDIQFASTPAKIQWPIDPERYRIETFVPGTPVSVSAIASGATAERPMTLLPPTGQQFDASPIGAYTAASHPLPERIARRATELARRAVAALPSTRGYFGIDMVIADAGPDRDVVIEVNPRLTTSYIKLREIVPMNLAEMMLPSATTTD